MLYINFLYMLQDLLQETGLTQEDIISQVSSEYERWYRFVTTKREVFEQDLKLFNNQKKNKDKIWDSTLFNIHSALMARSYVDRPQSKFVSTKIWRDYIVKNLNATLEEDFNESDIEVLKYQRDWDKFFYWVGIVAKTGWCGVTKQPTFETVDPRNWIPDPDWDYVNWKYSFTWFERQMFRTDLESEGYDEEIIEILNPNTWDFRWSDRSRNDDQVNSDLNPSFKRENAANPNYKIYTHFWEFKWPNGTVKAKVIMWNEQKTIIDADVLVSINKEEKKDHTLIPFPFAFTYWKPRTNNPFGDRVATFVSDVQRAKALIANLRLDKSLAELYPMYLYNTRLIKNKEDLNFGFNKLVAANPLEGESLGNAVAPITRDFRADNSYIIDNSLDQQVEASTSVGKITQGSLPSRRETATTNELQQDNTDINLALSGKVESWGEKQLLKLWLRGYLEKFAEWDVKIVNFNTGFGVIPRELRKKDFLAEKYVRIQVITVAELDKRRDKERLAYANTLPLLQTLERPKAAQNYSYRRFLISSWIPENQVDIEIPLTPQEIVAIENVEALTYWEFVEVKEDYDPLTHLIAIKAAPQELNTMIYRQSLLDLYKAQGGNPEQLTQVPHLWLLRYQLVYEGEYLLNDAAVCIDNEELESVGHRVFAELIVHDRLDFDLFPFWQRKVHHTLLGIFFTAKGRNIGHFGPFLLLPDVLRIGIRLHHDHPDPAIGV